MTLTIPIFSIYYNNIYIKKGERESGNRFGYPLSLSILFSFPPENCKPSCAMPLFIDASPFQN